MCLNADAEKRRADTRERVWDCDSAKKRKRLASDQIRKEMLKLKCENEKL